MADNSFQDTPKSTRDYHALGDFREALVGEIQPTATKPPRLSVYFHKNKVVMEVRTNVPADQNTTERGVIRAELDPPTFFLFLTAFERVINSNERPVAERINLKRPDFRKTNGGQPVLDSKVVFGRDKDGIVFMSVVSWNKERPMIMFHFHPNRFVEYVNKDGTTANAVDVSVDYAKAKLAQWRQLVPIYMYHRYVAEQFNKPQQQSQSQDMRTEARVENNDQSSNWDNLPF